MPKLQRIVAFAGGALSSFTTNNPAPCAWIFSGDAVVTYIQRRIVGDRIESDMFD